MANKQISQLPAASVLQNSDLLVAEQNGVAKSVTGTVLLAMLDGHGGIASTSYTPPVAPSLQGTLTLTFADGTTASVPIYNGAQGAQGIQGVQGERGAAFTYEDFTPEQLEALRGEQGVQGETGNPGYCHIKWAAVEPTSDADMSDTPDAWMGIYSGSSSTAPTAYTAYAWYEVKGLQGETGERGERGTWIWQATAEPTQIGNDYFISRSNLAYASGQTGTPRQGDMVWYNNTYYYVMLFNVLRDAYQVSRGYTFQTANVPSGGLTDYRLVKASNTDYDVKWDSPEVFYATYGSTSSSNIEDAAEAGKFVVLKSTTETQTYDKISDYCPLESVSVRYNSSDPAARLPIRRVAVFTKANVDGSIYWATATWALGQLADTWAHGTISPSGGSSDYTDLSNKPSINSVTLSGNKTAADLSLAAAADLAAKEDKVTEVTVSTAGAVTQALDAGKIYHFTGALTALTVTLNAAASGQIAHYHFDFDCGSTAPTVSIPNTVTMPDGNSFESNKHYEVDILNNYGAVISWPNS